MAAGGCSKANGRKSGNKKRQARKLGSWTRGQKRKDLRRHKNDAQPGTLPPPGAPQAHVPFVLHGIADPKLLIPLQRDDKKLVYEVVSRKNGGTG